MYAYKLQPCVCIVIMVTIMWFMPRLKSGAMPESKFKVWVCIPYMGAPIPRKQLRAKKQLPRHACAAPMCRADVGLHLSG